MNKFITEKIELTPARITDREPYKLTRIGCIVLGVLGVGFLLLIFITGDDAIKLGGYDWTLDLLMWLGIITLGLTTIAALIFSLIELATNRARLKSSLMSIGAFIGIIVIAYFLSIFAYGFNVETPMRDGKVLSANGSTLVGAGIIVFYILTIIAVALMAFPKATKFLKFLKR